jgi:signal transduction histidine kinase
LLQSDVSWPPEIYREFLETIDRETDRLDHVVGDLLLAVDSQPNLLSLNLQHASIDVLFDLAQADLELVDWSKAVTFQCEPGLPVALVDPTHLVRVLGHLIRCAAECTLPGEAIQLKACRR